MSEILPAPRRRFVKRFVLFALLHYAVLLCLAGLILFASHLLPKVFHLDGLILALSNLEQWLVAPRKLLLWLYPGELTPGWLGLATTVLNSLTWGFVLAVIKGLFGR